MKRSLRSWLWGVPLKQEVERRVWIQSWRFDQSRAGLAV